MSESPSAPALDGMGLSGARHPYRVALWVALAYLALALPCLGDFGPTWDMVQGDYPYGERLLEYLNTGDERFLDLKALEPAPPVRAPHPDFEVGRFEWFQIFPVGALLSAASCRLLWTELGWVPAMAAHHVVVACLAACLVFALTAFCARRLGILGGLVAGGSLALNPVFFGHACHNVKDVAECVFYTGAVLAGFVALGRNRTRWWLAAGALTALALAEKPNALFLPVQLALFLSGARLLSSVEACERPRLPLRGFLWTTLGFVLTYYAVSPAFWSSPLEGPRAMFGQMLSGGSAPGTAIEFQAPLTALYTTPLVTLALAAFGLLFRGLRPLERFFLVLGVGLPIARNLVPGMRHYDLTRHFIEYLPMLCALAGGGAVWLFERFRAGLRPARQGLLAVALGALAVLPCALSTLATHPNQITYFNALVGGLGGAQRAGIRDATDYWGNSYWQGLRWLSEQAEPRASLLVPIAHHVARSAAPVRLRKGLRLLPEGAWGPLPLYVMYITRSSRYGPFVQALEERHQPVHEIRVQGGVILRLHRLDGAEAPEWEAIWREEQSQRASLRRVLRFLRQNPAAAEAARPLLRGRTERERILPGLRALFPAEMHVDLEAALPMLLGEREGFALRASAEGLD